MRRRRRELFFAIVGWTDLPDCCVWRKFVIAISCSYIDREMICERVRRITVSVTMFSFNSASSARAFLYIFILFSHLSRLCTLYGDSQVLFFFCLISCEIIFS